MTTNQLAAACGFSCAVAGEDKEITGIFCGDLLSWAMGRAKAGDAWCTVMANVNTLAVATLADCACIVLCQGALPDEAMAARAAQQGIALFTTEQAEFEAALCTARAAAVCGFSGPA